jgi:hypothetical protein
VALVLIAIGVAWVLIDRVLQYAYPDEWGGPNIGGGFLVMISLMMIITGVVLMGTDTYDGWREGRH